MKMTKYLGVAAIAATLFTFTASANDLDNAKQAIKLDVELQLAQVRADIEKAVNTQEVTVLLKKANFELQANELIAKATATLPEQRFKVIIAE